MPKKEKKEEGKGTVIGPNGKVVKKDVPLGAHLRESEEGDKWVRRGSEKLTGAPVD